MSHFKAKLTALVIVLVVIGGTAPATAENVLRWATLGDGFDFDPHSHISSANQAPIKQVYELLLDIKESDLTISPKLAIAWTLLNPTTWRFQLRQNARFHDGTPFTAEDVVFSIIRAQAETSHFKS